MRRPRVDGDKIREQVLHYLREPFQNELAKLLMNAPNEGAIQKFANKAPDRYMQALTICSKLAGYQDKIEVDVNIKALTQLADTELRSLLKDLTRQLRAIDVTEESNEINGNRS